MLFFGRMQQLIGMTKIQANKMKIQAAAKVDSDSSSDVEQIDPIWANLSLG